MARKILRYKTISFFRQANEKEQLYFQNEKWISHLSTIL